MQANEGSTALPIGAHVWAKGRVKAALPARPMSNPSGIVPFETLVLPRDLDGSTGHFRAPQHYCMLEAQNDYQAVLAFIRSRRGLTHAEAVAITQASSGKPIDPFAWRKGLSNTQRAYLIELERFTLWAVREKKKPVSSITFEDCLAYRDFIANPTPTDLWCGIRSRRRIGPAWRPFAGPLGSTAQTRALAVLSAFYRFLSDKRYLTGNPMSGVAKPRPPSKRKALERVLTIAHWDTINHVLRQLPPTSANIRLRFAVRWLYTTGLRRHELLKATLGDLKFLTLPASTKSDAISGWELNVVGKGGVERDVAVPPSLIRELSQYLKSRGLNSDPLAPENRDVALIGQATDISLRAPWSKAAAEPVDPRRPISAQTFHDQLKAFFKSQAEQIAQTDPVAAAVFAKTSAHWFRHTRISHSLAAGTDLRVEMKNAGHKSPDTTAIYTHVDARERILGNAKFFNTLDDSEGVA
jgi:site-specific recombinase XerD